MVLLCIGNAILDILYKVDLDTITKTKLNPNSFNQVDQNTLNNILQNHLVNKESTFIPGGSASNTSAIYSILGGETHFVGKLGNDKYGQHYSNELQKSNIKFNTKMSNKNTGICISLITLDSERTFAVNLGAALDLNKADINENEIKSANIVHVEGYLFEDKNLRETTIHCLDIAKANDCKISIDLADANLIKRCKGNMQNIVNKYADIVFANETEAEVFTGLKNKDDIINNFKNKFDISIIKFGKNGSVVNHNNKTHEIQSFKVNTIDTTGAGDSYAGAFLYGFSKNVAIEKCGLLGSYVASEVVKVIGPRLNKRPDIDFITH